MKRIGVIYKKKRAKQCSQCEITLSQDLWRIRDCDIDVTRPGCYWELCNTNNTSKVVYVVEVKSSRPAVNAMGTADNISCSDPKFPDTVECPLTNLQTVNDGGYRENSLIMHPHCSNFEVARDFTEAHSAYITRKTKASKKYQRRITQDRVNPKLGFYLLLFTQIPLASPYCQPFCKRL